MNSLVVDESEGRPVGPSESAPVGGHEHRLGPAGSTAFGATMRHRPWNARDMAAPSVWFVLDRWVPQGNEL